MQCGVVAVCRIHAHCLLQHILVSRQCVSESSKSSLTLYDLENDASGRQVRLMKDQTDFACLANGSAVYFTHKDPMSDFRVLTSIWPVISQTIYTMELVSLQRSLHSVSAWVVCDDCAPAKTK